MPHLDQDLLKSTLLHARLTSVSEEGWDNLLLNCSTLSCFTSRIQKYAKIISKSKKVDFFDKFGQDGANVFKGDVTEIFAEFLLKGHGRNWGINNYQPLFINKLEPEQDKGVDGLGFTNDGRNVTVQVKFGDWSQSLDYTKRRLSTFHWTSEKEYNVGTTSKDQMFVFTLARDINWKTLDVHFNKRLKFIALEESGGSGGPYINGHVNSFFPYKIHYDNTFQKYNFKGWGMTIKDYPTGISSVPFTWNYYQEKFPMSFLAGFLGSSYSNNSLTPNLAWAVAENTSNTSTNTEIT